VDTRPDDVARFVVGGALLHDLVLAALVIIAGVLVGPYRCPGPAVVQAPS
jgi:hypothetical protein